MDFFHVREPVNTWTHFAGLVLAVVGTVVLWQSSRGAGAAKRLSLVVFGTCLMFCYAASALYHGVAASRVEAFDRLDRIGIFFLIAGTYTPLAWNLMGGAWRQATLGLVWLVAGVSSVLLVIGGPFPPVVTTVLYLAMGWGVVACYGELARVVSRRALRPMVVGGAFYSVGALFNLLHWPTLIPGIIGPHELFHLFVIAGSSAHYWLVLRVVVPPRTLVKAPTPAILAGRSPAGTGQPSLR